MIFRRYGDIDEYKGDVFDILLKEEDINNLPVSIIMDNKIEKADDWLLSTVTDEFGDIVLIAQCAKPFPLLLYEPPGRSDPVALKLLASELSRIDFAPSAVMTVTGLGRRFADAYCGSGGYKKHLSLVLMRLDKLPEYNKAPGFCRMLTEEDLAFTPSWEQAFSVDCRLPVSDLSENEERIRTRLDKDNHFIWVDGEPVSQAVFGRNTPNGAVINWVYTPPQFRGRGYATSLVAEVSQTLFDRGKVFCCLFADAANPVSRGVYRKLGYYDVQVYEELKFLTE